MSRKISRALSPLLATCVVTIGVPNAAIAASARPAVQLDADGNLLLALCSDALKALQAKITGARPAIDEEKEAAGERCQAAAGNRCALHYRPVGANKTRRDHAAQRRQCAAVHASGSQPRRNHESIHAEAGKAMCTTQQFGT